MARRPESEAILTRAQLAEFTRQLQKLSDDGVERIYETTCYSAACGGMEAAEKFKSHEWLNHQGFPVSVIGSTISPCHP
jgi:hypothetical protein